MSETELTEYEREQEAERREATTEEYRTKVDNLERLVKQLSSLHNDDIVHVNKTFNEVRELIALLKDRVFTLEYQVRALEARKWWQLWR